MYNFHHPQTQPHYGQSHRYGQPYPSYDQPKPPYAQTPHTYGLPQPTLMVQPPTPAIAQTHGSSDFAKVWAACIANASQRNQPPINQHQLHQPVQAPTIQPSTEDHAKISRWSQAVQHPPQPFPQQLIQVDQPIRPIPAQMGVSKKSPLLNHQHVMMSAPPVPDPNTLYRDGVLEPPATIYPVPIRRGRDWPMPSSRQALRSAQLLNQVTIFQHPTSGDQRIDSNVPVINTMKRSHNMSSPTIPTSSEQELDTPPDESLSFLVNQQVEHLPGSTDWVDDSVPLLNGNSQTTPRQIVIPPRDQDTPVNEEHMTRAAIALRRMYDNPKVDYSQSSQAMLALTLISAIPRDINAEAEAMVLPSSGFKQIRVVDSLVERFATAIYNSAMAHRAHGQLIPVGALQMLWELHFVSLKRWGPDSLLAEYTGTLAGELDEFVLMEGN